MTEVGPQRIDKWLWHARFARSRSGAQRLAISGDLRVNREKVIASSRLVHRGDVLTIASDRGVRLVRILGFSERRVSPELAQAFYELITNGEPGDATGQP